ncbi:MAG TPA: PDZ domain-containing protein [Prosthecobacter sp.]
MKPAYTALLALTGLLALLNSPARAQETSSPPPSSSPPAAVPGHKDRGPDSRRQRNQPDKDERPTAYIGVLTAPVPPELRSHFTLPEGFGLLVGEVMPDTPAKAGGIQENDILVRLDDQKLVNMEQLQTLVRSKKKGDQITFTLISGGQEKQVVVTVDERLMPAREENARGGERFYRSFGGPFFDGDRRGGSGFEDEVRGAMERYQKEMREYTERLRNWNRDNDGPRPQPPSWRGPGRRGDDRQEGFRRAPDRREGDRPRSEEHRKESHENRTVAHITRSDDSGIYSLKKEGDRSVFTAKPKDGQEQSWNVNNDTERRSIPGHLAEKLKLLEEVRGGSDKPAPMPLEPTPPANPAPGGDKGGL